MKNDKKPDDNTQYLPIFMCIGLSVGMAIGAAMNNTSIGMCIGMGIGVFAGAVLDSGKRKDPGDTEEET